MAGHSARETVTERDKDMGNVNKLESIVPPLELCKQIPAGEFEDAALVWVYDDVVGFLCRTSGCEQIHKKEWQLEHNHPRKIAIRRKSGHEIYPAPTLEETMTSLLNYDGWLLKIDSRFGLETFVELYSKTSNNRYVEYAPSACTAALRLWFKVKGIEVE